MTMRPDSGRTRRAGATPEEQETVQPSTSLLPGAGWCSAAADRRGVWHDHPIG